MIKWLPQPLIQNFKLRCKTLGCPVLLRVVENQVLGTPGIPSSNYKGINYDPICAHSTGRVGMREQQNHCIISILLFSAVKIKREQSHNYI